MNTGAEVGKGQTGVTNSVSYTLMSFNYMDILDAPTKKQKRSLCSEFIPQSLRYFQLYGSVSRQRNISRKVSQQNAEHVKY